MARWILLLVSIAALQAQTHVAVSSRTSVTAEKGTLQHDPTNQTRIQACFITINPSVAGTVYFEVSSSAATTTTVTPAATSPGGRTAKALAFTNSNAGAGTATSSVMNLVSGYPNVFSLKEIRLSGNGSTKNSSWVIALGSSGNVSWEIHWAEDGTCER